MNNDQCLYFICGALGSHMMTAGRKWRAPNIRIPSISDTTSSCVNTIQRDFLWSILYLYHLYHQISMSASIEAMLVTWPQIVPTLTALTTALVRKDTLGTDIHAKVWSSHKTSQIKKTLSSKAWKFDVCFCQVTLWQFIFVLRCQRV